MQDNPLSIPSPQSSGDQGGAEQKFWGSTIFSKKGKLYQLAFADNAGYNSPYNLFIRLQEGWLLVEQTLDSQKFLDLLDAQTACRLRKGNNLSCYYDRDRGIVVKLYGNWYSRSQVLESIKHTIGYHKASPVLSFKQPVYLLRRIYDRLRSVIHSAMYLGYHESVVGHSYMNPDPHPRLGHNTLVLGRYQRGFTVFPSGYALIARVLGMGGGSEKRCLNLADSIMEYLGQTTATYESRPTLWTLDQIRTRLSPQGDYSCTFIPDDATTAVSRLGQFTLA